MTRNGKTYRFTLKECHNSMAECNNSGQKYLQTVLTSARQVTLPWHLVISTYTVVHACYFIFMDMHLHILQLES